MVDWKQLLASVRVGYLLEIRMEVSQSNGRRRLVCSMTFAATTQIGGVFGQSNHSQSGQDRERLWRHGEWFVDKKC